MLATLQGIGELKFTMKNSEPPAPQDWIAGLGCDEINNDEVVETVGPSPLPAKKRILPDDEEYTILLEQKPQFVGKNDKLEYQEEEATKDPVERLIKKLIKPPVQRSYSQVLRGNKKT